MVDAILPLVVSGAVVKKQGQTLLGPVDLTIDGTGVTVVIGPNGSGKTTLLRLLHGLQWSSKGSLDWGVSEINARPHQSFVFQTPILLRRDVRDNLAYPLKLRGLESRETERRVEEWLERIDLAAHAQTQARFLSGGERQRVALARALITKPQVLFLDEPTSNLDGKSTRSIETLLKEAVQSGIRIAMTTHDLGQAKRLADEICFMHKGLIREKSSALEFFENPVSPEARAFLQGDIVE